MAWQELLSISRHRRLKQWQIPRRGHYLNMSRILLTLLVLWCCTRAAARALAKNSRRQRRGGSGRRYEIAGTKLHIVFVELVLQFDDNEGIVKACTFPWYAMRA